MRAILNGSSISNFSICSRNFADIFFKVMENSLKKLLFKIVTFNLIHGDLTFGDTAYNVSMSLWYDGLVNISNGDSVINGSIASLS